ncbi:aminopeptidase P family protein [Sinorhizobium meliloti]|uniref:M24 family metallopeptidase n=1 Tax=Rhizobium meliloti TaxID=382 RepID=UPI000FD2FE0B|nr:Xaa-Pro peptidase family protein [Sinorhizobium meliloti]MDW9534135.1 M24 family metallopeptidase [Sinorhizobium meliloti]MDW9689686.1 M24 family metallopeptidase [Sinorhizobium meliloti]MDX0134672.1 M24 family metallopeptidase [Sinorhizobium meliloti]RVH15943.1 aminopeptidase P family protein [Sinorhizobium meliloti]RVI75147.1 aminopeptidase P family protein [Sinorhizobium meliloti]
MRPGQQRTEKLKRALQAAGFESAILTNPDSIAYFGEYLDYLGIDFGRPTLMTVTVEGEPTIITPLMESEMCARMSWVADIRPWSDGINDEWRSVLKSAIEGKAHRVAIEKRSIPALVTNDLLTMVHGAEVGDAGPIISEIRMIKSADEIGIMRKAGEVAVAMVKGAREIIAEGVPEYEIALAVIAAGTRKAASFLDDKMDRFVSPTIYNLQILQSGTDVCMVHRRSSVRALRKGDPVYLCFCGIANFRNYKLGFDREFFVGGATDEQARVYDTAVAAQQAALAAIKPGIACEEINAAAEAVYTEAGFSAGYRTGRSVGQSFLEVPELKRGEKRLLQAGMTFAVDGGITIEGSFGGRVGDSIVVTDTGFEYLTNYPRELAVV